MGVRLSPVAPPIVPLIPEIDLMSVTYGIVLLLLLVLTLVSAKTAKIGNCFRLNDLCGIFFLALYGPIFHFGFFE